MTNEVSDNPDKIEEDGDKIEETKNENVTKEATNQPKQRTVSFNRDVHVKRFGKRFQILNLIQINGLNTLI